MATVHPWAETSIGDNWQRCEYPHPLLDLISDLRYWPDWKFSMEHMDRGQGSVGLTLVIELTKCRNSYRKPPGDPREFITVHHLFPVPPAAYNRQSWQRWLLEQILLVHTHEACEGFDVECPSCRGKGTWDGEFTKRSGERTSSYTCDKCNGEGYIKPFAPNHAMGYDPYRIVEYESDAARTTPFTGRVDG